MLHTTKAAQGLLQNLVVHPIDTGVVMVVETDQEARILRQLQTAKGVVQVARTQFARSARGLGVLGQLGVAVAHEDSSLS